MEEQLIREKFNIKKGSVFLKIKACDKILNSDWNRSFTLTKYITPDNTIEYDCFISPCNNLLIVYREDWNCYHLKWFKSWEIKNKNHEKEIIKTEDDFESLIEIYNKVKTEYENIFKKFIDNVNTFGEFKYETQVKLWNEIDNFSNDIRLQNIINRLNK
jgi:hypothetical protein